MDDNNQEAMSRELDELLNRIDALHETAETDADWAEIRRLRQRAALLMRT